MKFKYTGDDAENVMRGVTFPKGKGVEINDKGLAVKLRNLDYFEEVKRGRKKKNDEAAG